MKSSVFRFKQFEIQHHQSAMKVGTDGVVLGAWADVGSCHTILDIGAGTGLIALMLAQRNAEAVIDAVEIDKPSFEEMTLNFQKSDWHDRLHAHHLKVQHLAKDKKYDLIVSNPPYFRSGTESPNKARHHARHATSLSCTELCEAIDTHLKPKGRACIVIPVMEGEQLKATTKRFGLWLTKETFFIPRPDKRPERLLLQFERTPQKLVPDELLHYNADGTWSDAYKALTAAFHLKL